MEKWINVFQMHPSNLLSLSILTSNGPIIFLNSLVKIILQLQRVKHVMPPSLFWYNCKINWRSSRMLHNHSWYMQIQFIDMQDLYFLRVNWIRTWVLNIYGCVPFLIGIWYTFSLFCSQLHLHLIKSFYLWSLNSSVN